MGLTEIAAALGGAAVGEARGEVLELGLAGDDVLPERLELRGGALAGGAADDPALRILPRGLPPGSLVLDEDVRRADLVRPRRRRHLGPRPVLVPEAAGLGAGGGGGWIGGRGGRGLSLPLAIGGLYLGSWRRRRVDTSFCLLAALSSIVVSSVEKMEREFFIGADIFFFFLVEQGLLV